MRQLYIVTATQVVASEAHPEGMYSTVSGEFICGSDV